MTAVVLAASITIVAFTFLLVSLYGWAAGLGLAAVGIFAGWLVVGVTIHLRDGD